MLDEINIDPCLGICNEGREERPGARDTAVHKNTYKLCLFYIVTDITWSLHIIDAQ